MRLNGDGWWVWMVAANVYSRQFSLSEGLLESGTGTVLHSSVDLGELLQ